MLVQLSRTELKKFDLTLAPVLSGTGDEKVLLLSCIDLRYPHRIIDTMDQMFNLRGRYYHMALAGASLGVTKKEWQATFFEHLDFVVSSKVNVKAVIVLNHRNCGAFEHWLKVTDHDPIAEEKAHRADCEAAANHMVARHSGLKGHVQALLLPKEPPTIVPTWLADA